MRAVHLRRGQPSLRGGFDHRRRTAAAVKACRDRLAATGVDLAAYNSTENAADIAELRVALGIDSWNVYGVSYGSKLALTVLRNHPQGIRSVVLDSVSPPNEQHRRDVVVGTGQLVQGDLRRLRGTARLRRRLPEPGSRLHGHGEPPRRDAGHHPGHGRCPARPVTVNVDGFAFAYTLIMSSERGDVSGVPKMIADMARGDAASVAAAYLALRGPPEIIGLGGLGLAFTVFCAEHANLTTEAATLAHAKAVLPGFPERVLQIQPKQGRLFTECPIWNVGKAAPSVSAPAVSDVPVLILEGSFDAATAPEWVDVITPHLKNSQVVSFPFTGHSVLGKSQCAPSIMTAFLDNPTRPVDPTCAAQITVTFD